MKKSKARYTRAQLERLTTLQLRDICFKEKIVKGIANMLDREAFISTILRFRGANEDFLIKKYSQANYDRLKRFVKANLGDELVPKKAIANPAKLTVYRSLAIEPRDAYKVITEDKDLAETNVLLVDEQYSLCGIFHLLQDERAKDVLYLCMSGEMEVEVTTNKNYRLLYVSPELSEHLFDVYSGENKHQRQLNYYQVPLQNLEVRELEVSRETLAIDFGTSNTTAGIYLSSESSQHFSQHDILNGRLKINAINYVMFENIASEAKEWLELLPTVVSVENCHNPQNVTYQYGYEVIRHDHLTGGNDLSSTFYEIKRWVNTFDKTEEVSDHKGNVAWVKRSDIIAGYIKYVINHAEQQFKCRFKHLHISSPVKLKSQFIEMFKRILGGYTFEETDALDEGVAVLYNTIENQIHRETFEDGVFYKALIIDCGGGTTDLSSCIFKIEENRLNYQIDVNTTYENGDTNFGGNNLTYRLMQYLKILIANAYQNPKQTIDYSDVMEVLIGDVYRYLDDHGKDALYEKLEAKYQACEAFLPTQYSQYLNKSNNEYMRIKANYYTIWRLANEIKQRFFEEVGLMELNLATAKLNGLTGFKLTVVKDKKLDYVYQLPQVKVTLPEIRGLIKGDIYDIIKKFLETLYLRDELQEFSIIKMTGQSCRIDLFRDSIKEFIPGRQIEFRQKENHLLDLKLACLNGVLRYLHAKKTGMIRAVIENSTPITPYSIFAYTHKNEQKMLLTSSEAMTQQSGFISKHRSIKEMVFYLANIDEQVQTTYVYLNNEATYQTISYDDFRAKYDAFIQQDDLDNIVDDEVKFFVYATADNWGFNILPVTRTDNQLKIGDKVYFPFENEQWELNFFDGEK
ncbi:MAG: molecular chaperone [Defluviitaleaceae bacterium]|nr:molecular chaperone [Defluviitaleaceae bacterium]